MRQQFDARESGERGIVLDRIGGEEAEQHVAERDEGRAIAEIRATAIEDQLVRIAVVVPDAFDHLHRFGDEIEVDALGPPTGHRQGAASVVEQGVACRRIGPGVGLRPERGARRQGGEHAQRQHDDAPADRLERADRLRLREREEREQQAAPQGDGERTLAATTEHRHAPGSGPGARAARRGGRDDHVRSSPPSRKRA